MRIIIGRWTTENSEWGVEKVASIAKTRIRPRQLKKLAEDRALRRSAADIQYKGMLSSWKTQTVTARLQNDAMKKIDNVAALWTAYVAYKQI